jgi:hypothetical protein
LWSNDIVDFEDHFDDLGGELKLLLLGENTLKDTLLGHVSGALVVGVNTDESAVGLNLLFLDLTYVVYWVVAGVLSQGHWNFFQGVGESSYSVLFNT